VAAAVVRYSRLVGVNQVEVRERRKATDPILPIAMTALRPIAPSTTAIGEGSLHVETGHVD
jgi:hypothetical protein